MKRYLILYVLLILPGLYAISQNQPAQNVKPASAAETPSSFGIKFSGYVNSDIFFDSRQTVMARDGQWLFYPENIKPDAEGKDINAKGTYNILSIQTRVTGTITGPDVLGAKTSGLIEGEFYGSANASINSLRLRHAYVRLNWRTTELQFGQYWHPMFVPACFPEVVSLNTGAPFLVFARNPQVRITQQAGRFRFLLAAIAQLDATSTGPEGPNPKYLRNSMIPEMAFQVQYARKNDERQSEFLAGASVDFLVLTPKLNTEVVIRGAYDTVVNNVVVHHDALTSSYVTTAKSPALTFNVFTKVKFRKWAVKAGGVLGQDCHAFNMIGGYAVKSVTDPVKATVSYAAITTLSGWLDLKTNGAPWQTGIYFGYSRNLGAGTEVSGPFYSRGANIDYLYRVAPRLVFQVKKLKFAGEVDYTVAAYGKITGKGMVSDSKEVGNLRLLIGVYYYF